MIEEFIQEWQNRQEVKTSMRETNLHAAGKKNYAPTFRYCSGIVIVSTLLFQFAIFSCVNTNVLGYDPESDQYILGTR